MMVLPAIGLVLHMEDDAAVLGFDAFDFGGSILRKVTILAERVGFMMPVPYPLLRAELNLLFNAYCLATRPSHTWTDFLSAETTSGEEELKVEREIFGAQPSAA